MVALTVKDPIINYCRGGEGRGGGGEGEGRGGEGEGEALWRILVLS